MFEDMHVFGNNSYETATRWDVLVLPRFACPPYAASHWPKLSRSHAGPDSDESKKQATHHIMQVEHICLTSA